MRLLAIVVMAALPVLAAAAPVQVTFSGRLVTVDDGLAPQFAVGDPFSYSFTYDSNAPDLSGTPDYSKFATGPFLLDINGYSVSQSESFMWNGFNPVRGGVMPDRISITNLDTTTIAGDPAAATGPVLEPFDAGFRWRTSLGQASADVPPAGLGSSDFSSQRGIFSFFDPNFSPPNADIGVEVEFDNGDFIENPDGSISIEFSGSIVGPWAPGADPDYQFLPDEFQPGSAFSMSATIGAGQTDLNPVDGEGLFLAENAVMTSDSFSATMANLRVTTVRNDVNGRLEIRLLSNSGVAGPSLPTLTSAVPAELFASIIDDQLGSLFDLSMPLTPFDINDVELAGFGLDFLRGGGFDDVVRVTGFADRVVFEPMGSVSLPASIWLFGPLVLGLLGLRLRPECSTE